MNFGSNNYNTELKNALNTIWRYNEAAILDIEIVYPQSLYVYVPEAPLKKGINIPLGYSVSNVFVAPADNSTGYVRRGSSVIAATLNEEIKNYLKSNSSAKLIPLSCDLAVFDPITGLHDKLKVANIQLINDSNEVPVGAVLTPVPVN